MSKIKKIAPETDSAEANRLLTTVALKGAKRPKLMKMIVSQRTSMTSSGRELLRFLFVHQPARLSDIHRETKRLALERALRAVFRRKALDLA